MNEDDEKVYRHLSVGDNLMTLKSIVRAEVDEIHSRIQYVQSLHGQIKCQRLWTVDLINGESSMIGAVQLRGLHIMLMSGVAPEHTTNTAQQYRTGHRAIISAE